MCVCVKGGACLLASAGLSPNPTQPPAQPLSRLHVSALGNHPPAGGRGGGGVQPPRLRARALLRHAARGGGAAGALGSARPAARHCGRAQHGCAPARGLCIRVEQRGRWGSIAPRCPEPAGHPSAQATHRSPRPPTRPHSRVDGQPAPAVCGAGGGQAAGAAPAGGPGPAPARARVCGHQGASQGAAQVGCTGRPGARPATGPVDARPGAGPAVHAAQSPPLPGCTSPHPTPATHPSIHPHPPTLAPHPPTPGSCCTTACTSTQSTPTKARRRARRRWITSGGRWAGGRRMWAAAHGLAAGVQAATRVHPHAPMRLARQRSPACPASRRASQGGAHLGADCHRPHWAGHGLSGGEHRGELA